MSMIINGKNLRGAGGSAGGQVSISCDVRELDKLEKKVIAYRRNALRIGTWPYKPLEIILYEKLLRAAGRL